MKRRHLRLAAATSLVLATLASPVAADPEALARCGERAVESIQTRYGDVRDLAAEFVQTSRSVGPSGAQAATASSGTVVLQVPGKMRWSYEKPEQSLVVSDGETLWLFDPGFGEAQKLPVTDDDYLSGAAIQFLLGKGNLSEEFEILPLACDEASAELKLTPRKAATYEFLTVWTDPREGLIQRTEIFDLLGNRTQVEFRNVSVNQGPDASVFRFEPPEGVTVVELSPTP